MIPSLSLSIPTLSSYTPALHQYTHYPTRCWVHPTDDGACTIRKGRPFAQLYSFGVTFMEKVTRNREKVIRAPTTNSTNNSSKPSLLYDWNSTSFHHHYDAGPPYMALASDMYTIVNTWAAFVVPVYELTTGHFSEMYVYSTAAAHVSLPHVLSYSFIVSNPEMGEKAEGWDGGDGAKASWIKFVNPTMSYPFLNHQFCITVNDTIWGPTSFKTQTPKTFLSDCSHPLFLNAVQAEQRLDWPCLFSTSVTLNGQFKEIKSK